MTLDKMFAAGDRAARLHNYVLAHAWMAAARLTAQQETTDARKAFSVAEALDRSAANPYVSDLDRAAYERCDPYSLYALWSDEKRMAYMRPALIASFPGQARA